jgi:hypothetical protein
VSTVARVRPSIDGNHAASISSPAQSFSVTKDSSKTVVSQIATHALYGAEASVNFTARVTSSNGGAIPAGEAVTIHVGSATCDAVTNGSEIATCSMTNSAVGSGSYPVGATYAGDSNIAGSTSTNSLSFAVWAKPTFTAPIPPARPSDTR